MHGSRVTKDRAKSLRRRLSLPEVVLWQALRGGKLSGLHFRKQHPLGPYILDFYCHAVRLAVEIDGEGHSMGDNPRHDAQRDRWLAEQGVRTLRISAALVLNDVDNATRTIAAFLANGVEPPLPPWLEPPPALRATSP
jgi:very-short-patch-repair endonuclease